MEIPLFATTWMGLEDIMLGKINKTDSWKKRLDLCLPKLGVGWGNLGKMFKRCKLPVVRCVSSGAVMYSMVAIMNNTVLYI